MKSIKLLLAITVMIVTAYGCKKNNSTPAPVISSISPDNGVWSTVVTIRGSNFSSVLSENEVQFNGVAATVVSVSADILTAEVPKGAGSGPVTVTVNGKTATGPEFTYTYLVTVSTFAGSTEGYADGSGAAAQFFNPRGVCTDAQGNVFVGDVSNYRVRKITPAGVVSTFAGSIPGNADGSGTAAQFARPWDLCTDALGNVYVADVNNHRIRKITPTGVVSTFAGSTEGNTDGSGTAAQFYSPAGICTDAQGNVYVTDAVNHNVRKITPSGVVSTLAGSTQGYADGSGASARFNSPRGICADAQGNIYVAEAGNHKIRKITPGGVVSTLAGSTGGYADGSGTVARFSELCGMTIDALGNLYVADYFNFKIRKITPDGIVSTVAGSTSGYQDGNPATAMFGGPYGVSIDTQGNLYVADNVNAKIRKITIE